MTIELNKRDLKKTKSEDLKKALSEKLNEKLEDEKTSEFNIEELKTKLWMK